MFRDLAGCGAFDRGAREKPSALKYNEHVLPTEARNSTYKTISNSCSQFAE
jgi:hypothetical protein